MQTAPFEYFRPTTLEEAIEMLASVDGARPLAGGHSLLPAMKLRVSSPPALVDIGRLPGLEEIRREGDSLMIGALASHAAIAASDLVRAECLVLAETASHIGDPQVRNRGTIGGSLAHADPAADYPTLMLALDAVIHMQGPGGTRSLAAREFFVDIFTTGLQPGELVTSIEVPVVGSGRGAAYAKHRHPASGFAVVGVAAVVAVEGGQCTGAAVAVGGVTGKPERATSVEESLTGHPREAENIARAASGVAVHLPNPIGDHYASGDYRVHLASVLTKRALTTAFDRAGGG